jgi:hypothetical protein
MGEVTQALNEECTPRRVSREAVRMGQSVAQAARLEAGPCLPLNHLEVLAHVDEDVYNEARDLWETNGAVHGRDGTLPLGPL